MSLVRWEPFNQLLSLQNQVNRIFNDTLSDNINKEGKIYDWLPSIEVSENNEGYNLRADLPGIKKDDIDISFNDNVLTIKGERKFQEEENKNNYFRKEISYGSFQRELMLHNDVDSSNIKANFADGVLELIIPKSDKSKTRTIEIE